jgi:general secretion pathway protein J
MRRRTFKTSLAGFTLLEMLVALAIFALLSVMSYGGLRSVMEQQAATELEAEQLGQLQKIYLLMQRDFEQAVPRAVRDE